MAVHHLPCSSAGAARCAGAARDEVLPPGGRRCVASAASLAPAHFMGAAQCAPFVSHRSNCSHATVTAAADFQFIKSSDNAGTGAITVGQLVRRCRHLAAALFLAAPAAPPIKSHDAVAERALSGQPAQNACLVNPLFYEGRNQT